MISRGIHLGPSQPQRSLHPSFHYHRCHHPFIHNPSSPHLRHLPPVPPSFSPQPPPILPKSPPNLPPTSPHPPSFSPQPPPILPPSSPFLPPYSPQHPGGVHPPHVPHAASGPPQVRLS
ncbi:unnamed protein product [Closterium sp. NIES-53]